MGAGGGEGGVEDESDIRHMMVKLADFGASRMFDGGVGAVADGEGGEGLLSAGQVGNNASRSGLKGDVQTTDSETLHPKPGLDHNPRP